MQRERIEAKSLGRFYAGSSRAFRVTIMTPALQGQAVDILLVSFYENSSSLHNPIHEIYHIQSDIFNLCLSGKGFNYLAKKPCT